MSERSAVARAFGWLLVVLGGLWALLTGGCTLVLLASSVQSLASPEGGSAAAFILFVGAACMAPGGLMLWGGLTLVRRHGADGG
jgi:hypothetical protein